MRATILHAPGDVRVEEIDDPKITAPTDAIIRLTATCVCGSDLWPYRGIESVDRPMPMGHEYVGIVEEVGSGVKDIKPGQYVVGSFVASCGTCEICRSGYPSSCVNRVFMAQVGTQAERALVPHAGRHPRTAAGHPRRGPDPQPPGRLRRAGHRLVRRGGRRGRAGQDRGGRR
jgi:threonine dehydrogenase-like Zn-dependent dehydrogenase